MKSTNHHSSTLLTRSMLIAAVSFSLLPSISYADFGVGLSIDNDLMQYKDKDDDINLTALFNLQYQGEKFNLNKDAMSYDVYSGEKYAVEVIAATKNRGFRAKDNKTFEGMAERDPSLDLGGRVIFDTGSIGTLVVDVTKDVNESKGIEAGIKLGGIAPHAAHWTGKKQLNIAAVGGLRYQSAKVVDHYYGVKNSEATASRSAYKGKSAITPFIGFEAQANISKHVTLDGDLGLSKTATAIKNSSITDNDDYRVSANVGVTYWF